MFWKISLQCYCQVWFPAYQNKINITLDDFSANFKSLRSVWDKNTFYGVLEVVKRKPDGLYNFKFKNIIT